MKFIAIPDGLVPGDGKKVDMGPPPGHEDHVYSVDVVITPHPRLERKHTLYARLEEADLEQLREVPYIQLNLLGAGMIPVSLHLPHGWELEAWKRELGLPSYLQPGPADLVAAGDENLDFPESSDE